VFHQAVVVHYQDGTTKEATLSQWSIGQFAQWSSRQNLQVDIESPGLMGVVMLRYQAYCELHRDPTGPRPTFEKWDMTVVEVEALEGAEQVDPTGPAALVG
jgi:hypothetical protein